MSWHEIPAFANCPYNVKLRSVDVAADASAAVSAPDTASERSTAVAREASCMTLVATPVTAEASELSTVTARDASRNNPAATLISAPVARCVSTVTAAEAAEIEAARDAAALDSCDATPASPATARDASRTTLVPSDDSATLARETSAPTLPTTAVMLTARDASVAAAAVRADATETASEPSTAGARDASCDSAT